MARIFISYKRVDKDKVFKIKDQIESALGEKCWIDLDGIESDALFKKVIIKAINECDIFLFMYSKAHTKIADFEKDWTIRELNFAALKNKRFVFINLDGSRLIDFFAFDYGTKQQVDGTSSEALRHLCSDLKHWLPSTASKAPTPDNHSAHTPQNTEKYIITILKPSELKLHFVKTIMETLGWKLKESHDFVESIPATIPFYFDQRKAESVVQTLKQTGAKIECHPITSIDNIGGTEYEITITKHGNAKLWLVKIINDTFGWGLAKSKALVDSLPTTIPHQFNKHEAMSLVEKLEKAGATVTCRAIGFNQFPT